LRRRPGMRNERGTQVGARRKIPPLASRACRMRAVSDLLDGAVDSYKLMRWRLAIRVSGEDDP